MKKVLNSCFYSSFKLAVEVYEFSHCGRNIYFERKRQKAIESKA